MCYNSLILSIVYNRREYIEIVGRLAEHSMKAAVEEVESLPDYSTKGEVYLIELKCNIQVFILFDIQWVITDARHDSTANAYHTTVPCLSGR